ncbi:MAG: UDP-3-O-acyl-N-acetylglucosamine deacetylase, partial [Candidatus Omnitrophica bacterium]|nr:UDP-3-O-acyl-N-acetylglucosamine deacetylase [Candidatus Omnitrophota bacterium]
MQKTIKEEILLRGKGIHTGEDVELRMRPLGPDMGIIFQRVDLPEKPMVRADIQAALAAKKQSRRTAIGCGAIEIQTIEHLMAVFSCFGIDNVLVETNGPEVPGMDGSALKFVEAVKKAGIVEQGAPRRTFKVTAPLFVEGETSAIAVFPSSDFRISYTLSYDHPMLGDMFLDLKIDAQVFEKEVAPARTFCLQEEAQELMKSGMGKGANYENTLV